MDCKKRLLQVNTPKSVGTIVNPDSENLRVGSLLVKSALQVKSVVYPTVNSELKRPVKGQAGTAARLP